MRRFPVELTLCVSSVWPEAASCLPGFRRLFCGPDFLAYIVPGATPSGLNIHQRDSMNSSRKPKQDDRYAAKSADMSSTRNGVVEAGEALTTQARDSGSLATIHRSTGILVGDASEPGVPDENTQDVAFTIVDDPKNESVYKGAGSYAATRAETAVRAVEEAFPLLHFDLRFEKNLTALHVRTRVHSSVENDLFLAVLLKALTSTATRLAPMKS